MNRTEQADGADATRTAQQRASDEFEAKLAAAGEPEVEISLDIARRGLIVGPILVVAAALIWGGAGAASAAVGVALVIVNFVLSAAMMAVALRISVGALMGSVMFGYLLRLGLILVVFLLVRDLSWFSAPAFGLAIIVTHLGLLAWELKYVSLTLAHPGLKPNRPPV